MLWKRRNTLYTKFKENQLQQWMGLSVDPFPWTSLHEVVKLNEVPQEASQILQTYKNNVMNKYYPNRQWTCQVSESASFAVLLADSN